MSNQTITWTKLLFLTCFCIFISKPGFCRDTWRALQPGLDYVDLNYSYVYPWAHIHVFKIDLNQYQLNSLQAKQLEKKYALVDEFSHFSGGLITLNGGFFDNNFRPLGLRINNEKLENPLKSISWWGVLYIKNNQAYLSSASVFQAVEEVDFAIQSGPRLIIEGAIPRLKKGKAERSALGITAEGKLIIVVTDHTPLSTKELAQLMKNSPLNCVNALNLDGGSSSQLRVALEGFSLAVAGFAPISDAITISKKK